MNIWLLGNGFDLAHSLPTKYENFIHTMEFLINHKDKKFKTVGEIFGNYELRNKDKLIDESYKKYADLFDKVFFSDLRYVSSISNAVEIANSNPWFRYFRFCFNYDEKGWIDFEKEIAKVVSAFKQFLKENSKNYFLWNSFDDEELQVIENFNFFYKKAKFNSRSNKIEAFIEESNIRQKILDDCGVVDDKFLISKPYGSINKVIDKEEIVKTLFESLKGFSELLIWYLRIFIESILSKISERNGAFDIKNTDYVISFNYTHTAEKLYEQEKVFHIHGAIDGYKYVVLGINADKDDNAESVDTLFLNFKKYYQRVFYNTDVSYLKILDEIKDYKRYRDRYEVHLSVIGHSLDITDEDILRELFDLADNIDIHCHNQNVVGIYIENLIKLYGRENFDSLRKTKNLKFVEDFFNFEKFNC